MSAPEEVAQRAIFFAYPSPSAVTGTAHFVDGGHMIKR